jgi:RNA polymerase sigma-70 factor, ECF subfamily
MGRLPIPQKIEEILAKPGSSWTSEDRDRVLEWLWEIYDRRLLIFALHHLGPYATPEDAEDTLQEFFEKILARVIATYDPIKGDFVSYVYSWLEQFCRAKRRQIERRARREQPIIIHKQDQDEDYQLEPVDEDENVYPEQVFLKKETEKEVKQKLEECINKLKPIYRTVVVMHYFEGLKIVEIAARLDCSTGNVKWRLFEARRQLKKCLEKEVEIL